MLSFESDYIIGAHEKVLAALIKTNNETMSGYGNDHHTRRAKELIKSACESLGSEVFFLTGGTQANQVVISTMLKGFEGVISAKTGHIALHEVGALCGEAVVFAEGEAPERFLSQTKQHGAMLAKGRLTGVQFEALFEDGLYFEISKNAIDRAEESKELFALRVYEFYLNSPTNQQFVILDDKQMAKIGEKCRFGFWEKLPDGRTVVRFATSFATTKEDVEKLAKII